VSHHPENFPADSFTCQLIIQQPKTPISKCFVATLEVVDGSNLNTSFMFQIVVHPIYHGINSSTKGILSQCTISPSKCREKDLIDNHRELFLLHSKVAAEQRG
jgi:hypothetical protein